VIVGWPTRAHLNKDKIILFPTGSTEQHGKHLVLDTDTFILFEIAKRVAKETNVLVAPPMPFGQSVHHMAFPGTITLSFDTLVNVYIDVCKSLLNHGFDKIVFMNGHGGNTDPISEAIRRVREDTGKIIYALSVGASQKGFGSESLKFIKQETGGHACERDTSVVLYLGERVLINKAEKWKFPNSWTEFYKKYFEPKTKLWISPITRVQYFNEITEIGSLGDPIIASKEKGKQMG